MATRVVSKSFTLLVLALILCVVQGLANAPVYWFSGSLQIKNGWNPYDEGTYPDPIKDEDAWVLHIQTDDTAARISLNTAACRLVRIGHVGPYWEIPTEWRVWDSTSNQDGQLDPGELVDSGWLPVVTFMETFQDNPIVVSSGWSGEIYFQVRMTRYGLGNNSGDYSAALTVDVAEDQ